MQTDFAKSPSESRLDVPTLGEIISIFFKCKDKPNWVDDESDDNAENFTAAEFAADTDPTVPKSSTRSKSNAKSTTSQCHIATKRAQGAASRTSTSIELTATLSTANLPSTATANLPSNATWAWWWPRWRTSCPGIFW